MPHEKSTIPFSKGIPRNFGDRTNEFDQKGVRVGREMGNEKEAGTGKGWEGEMNIVGQEEGERGRV